MSTLDLLRAEALGARGRGDHAGAVEAWHRALERCPDDAGLAVELRQDLRAGHHYPDSDAWFRRAARSFDDEAWLAHYGALYAFHGSDLEAIDARARALLSRWPESSRLQAIIGDVARQRRDWGEAERAFAAAYRLDPSDVECLHRAGAARLYQRLGREGWPDGGPGYAVFVINMDRNAERMVELDRAFAGSAVGLRRIPAVEGSRIPAAAVGRLTGEAGSPRGTLGCFLSHVAAWEALLAGSEACALVIEDDVIPLLDLPARLGGIPLPEGWDLLFVNDRLEPRRDCDGVAGFTTQTLGATMVGFPPEDNAPGADGYLVSRAGARTLLDWVARDGMAGDVDWRLLAYGLSAAEIAAIPAGSHARRELDRLQAGVPGGARLAAHVLHPALIRTVGVSSDREDQNRIGPAAPA